MENTKEIDIAQAIEEVVKDVIISKKGLKWLNILKQPKEVQFSHTPGDLDLSIRQKPYTETSWQRELYRDEDIWMDAELPISANRGVRVDLLGKYNDKYVLCELKYGQSSDNPLTVVLQLIAYLKYIKENYSTLDNLHHENARSAFPWGEFIKNPILLFRANNDYWSHYRKFTQYDKVKAILDILPNDIHMYFYDDKKELILKEELGKYTISYLSK